MSAWGDMMRRSSGDKIRTEDAWGNLTDPNKLLEDREIAFITKAALAEFEFGGFSSLDEMLCQLGVMLEISPDTPSRAVPADVSEWDLYWKNEMKRLEAMGIKDGPLYNEAKNEAEKASAELTDWLEMKLLGRYDRFSKKILLFPNNMEKGIVRKKYLATTFVHEAMHAYFDRHRHELFPYVATVEEPMAEFGMLLFFKEAKGNESFSEVFSWAMEEVGSKKTCYRYGYALMQQHLKEAKDQNSDKTRTRKDLESYKRKLL